jgi:hypothetical protein
VAGLSAYAKGVSLGIVEPRPELVRERGDRVTEGERLQANLVATSREPFPVSGVATRFVQNRTLTGDSYDRCLSSPF